MIKLPGRFSMNRPKLRLPDAVRGIMLASAGLSLLILMISVAYYIVAQPQLPIFYSLATANQRLAPKLWLLIFPLFSILINIVHVTVLSLISDYEEVLLRLFGFFTIIIQAVLLLAVLRIVYITW